MSVTPERETLFRKNYLFTLTVLLSETPQSGDSQMANYQLNPNGNEEIICFTGANFISSVWLYGDTSVPTQVTIMPLPLWGALLLLR